jgi:hypothetical protein
VATDVCSRGLDVPNVMMVVNYDMPGQIEDYVHRIGRTGRVGNNGCATTFITRKDSRVCKDLVRLQAPIPHIPLACFESSWIFRWWTMQILFHLIVTCLLMRDSLSLPLSLSLSLTPSPPLPLPIHPSLYVFKFISSTLAGF